MVLLLVGPIYVLAGMVMTLFPPKEINGLYGYRTRNSMKNQERWNFAQKYSAKEMIKLGGILLISSGLGLLFNPSKDMALILGIFLMVAITVVLFLKVEKEINRRFGKVD
ncbi:SdpI family protein [Aequorivita sp. H23M31]|uniref:SdpI family protein n=2 Tax=Aequorivita ciconiae TaxID=2494375 RepID=A0A410G771_9FLAO|nr:SdpI family protein [Aequorivita sp. H23M31]